MTFQRTLSRRAMGRGVLAVTGIGLVAGASASPAVARARQEASPVAAPMGAPVPESPVGSQFSWVVDQLNAGAVDLGEEEVGERFDDAFLGQVPAATVIDLFRELSEIGPFQIDSYQESADGLQARALIAGGTGERLAVTVVVEPDEPYRMTGLLFQPPEPMATPEPLASWQELDEQWSALAPSASFLAAEVVDSECVPVHALNPEPRLAIGSTFKLYILAELAQQVRGGEVGWDQPLAIRDEWKSLPTGDMRQLEAGEERPLREFAAQMISVSDNTATDHLLYHLGRERVEAIQAEMDHGEPAVNQPMLATNEFFKLKLVAAAELLETFLAAPVEEKRALLEDEVLPLTVSLEDAGDWLEPRLIETVEYFASVEDLCQAMATLDRWSGEAGLEPIAEILSINPGIELDPDVWTYVGFKGGSEPGVFNGTWLLRPADGRTFVMAGTLNNTEALVDELAAILLFQAAGQLLGESV